MPDPDLDQLFDAYRLALRSGNRLLINRRHETARMLRRGEPPLAASYRYTNAFAEAMIESTEREPLADRVTVASRDGQWTVEDLRRQRKRQAA